MGEASNQIGDAYSVMVRQWVIEKAEETGLEPRLVREFIGGIFNDGTLTIYDSTISGNEAVQGRADDGGGIKTEDDMAAPSAAICQPLGTVAELTATTR